jgi:tetratricopeptide (TPR) repeat protein
MARLAVVVSVTVLSFMLAGCNGNKDANKTEPVVVASDSNSLYAEARQIEEHAGAVVKDQTLLKMALGKYEQFINQNPKSGKISEAAFRMGGIYEYLKDYPNAVKYYQRTYQWDPQTPTTARYKAAYLLDNYLGRRAEALQLYQEALAKITKSGEHQLWVELAEKRVKELSGETKPQP